MKQYDILVDCDGVIADFVGSALKWVNDKLGTSYTEADIKEYDLFAAIGQQSLWKDFHKMVSSGGFCKNIRPYQGAKRLIQDLNDYGNVFVVTKPLHCPTWYYERTEWLNEHFGIPKNHVIFASEKRLIGGSLLIEDSFDNCVEWSSENFGPVILIDKPYNRVDMGKHEFVRAMDYDDVLYEVNERLGNI